MKKEAAMVVIEENVRPFINHVYVDYLKLPDRELKILMALKSFAWSQKENCYPRLASICEITGKGRRQVIETLKVLQQKGLIRIESNAGRANIYYITNKPIESINKKSKKQPVRKSALHPCGNPHQGSAEIRTHNNISNNTKKKREHARKKHAPLPQIFEPTKEHIEFARQNQINLSKELEAFKNRAKGKRTHYEFQRWLEMAVEYKTKASHKPQSAAAQSQRCTVPDWGPGHPTWEAMNGGARKSAH